MKDRIENIVIVGMGALGLLFGDRIAHSLGPESLHYLMDHDKDGAIIGTPRGNDK